MVKKKTGGKLAGEQRYFVGPLDEHSYRPSSEAAYEVQILNEDGQADKCAYIGRDSSTVIALIDFTPEGPKALAVEGHGVPLPVIEAARRQEGFGEYVDERGEIMRPSFFPPSVGTKESG